MMFTNKLLKTFLIIFVFDMSLSKQTFSQCDRCEKIEHSLFLKFNQDVRFTQPGGIAITDGDANNIVLALIVDEWLEGVDIKTCLDEGDLELTDDNLLLNDKTDKCDIEKTIKKNIKGKYNLKKQISQNQ